MYLLYALDLVVLALFFASYYLTCYRHGYRVDFWHAQLFLLFIFPNMIMLPFATSELNLVILGSDFNAVVSAVPTVFLITLIGYSAVLIGSSLWRVHLGVGMRKGTARLLSIVPRCSMMLMSSSNVLVFQSALCLILQLLMLSLYFSRSGFGFDLRTFTFENPQLRPIALLTSGYSVLIASHCLARYADTREKVLLRCTLILTIGIAFFGSRGSVIGIYISVLLCYLVKLRRNISLVRIISTIVLIIATLFYLGNLRAGDYSFAGFAGSFIFLLFYGNNFSDLRDFAWVYSAWNHLFWGGKTYVAAIVSFVPRFASHFRDTWAIGAMTASTAGFDPQVHPGLRPGYFGEGFFNFGLPGVVAVGLLLGIALRRVDIDVKRAFSSSQPSMMKAFASTTIFGVATTFAISAGFSGLYVVAGIYLFSWFCLCVERIFHSVPVLNESFLLSGLE